MTTTVAYKPRTDKELAARIARDIPSGWIVNLGIGQPTTIADHVPADREVLFHSENGILGMGPTPGANEVDPWLINAGKQHVTLKTGASLFHHADSFAMICGRHLDLCVLGAYQVASNGDLANWNVPDPSVIPGIGGAMDLAAGAKRIWIMMSHTTKKGGHKLLQHCDYPLTAIGCVKRVYTELATLDVTERGFELVDKVDGLSIDTLQAVTGAPIHKP